MIKILAVGKSKEKAMLAMIDEYRKRLSPFTKLEIIEVNDEHAPQTNSDAENEQVKEKEGKKTAVTGQGWRLCHPARPVGKKMYDSPGFAKKMDQLQTQGNSSLVFVIAGSLGPSKEIVSRSNLRWKLSDLTFTHQMTRVLVLEQIYRAYMINHNRPYHK